MSRILAAVSSQWAASRLVPPVADLALKLSAEVLIVHVARPSGGQTRAQEQSDGEAALAEFRSGLAGRQVSAQTLLLFSEDIATAIVNTAVERQATLIVLGMTSKNVFARLLAGNVPVELIKSTKIPVLLVPPEWNTAV